MDVLQAILILIFFGVLWLAPQKKVKPLLLIGVAAIVSAFIPSKGIEGAVTNAMAIDSLVCMSMYFAWTVVDSMKCYVVGLIGLFKNALSFAFLATGMVMSYSLYAYAISLALVLQMIVAGGLLNNVGSRLDDLLLRFAPKRHSLLRNRG